MQQVVRFWIIVISFVSSAISFSYLFLSVWQPGARLVTTGTGLRLAVMAVAMVSIGVFTWAAVFATPNPETTGPGKR